MVLDMVDLANIKNNQFKFYNKKFNFWQHLTTIISIQRIQCEIKGIKLQLKIDDDVPKYLISDPTRIKQILMNFIGNAIKYTSKGHIYVKVSLKKDWLISSDLDIIEQYNYDFSQSKFNENDNFENNQRMLKHIKISVRDTGCGMSLKDNQKLFKLFGQVKSTKKVNESGIGLGLSMCKFLIEKFKGKIQV